MLWCHCGRLLLQKACPSCVGGLPIAPDMAGQVAVLVLCNCGYDLERLELHGHCMSVLARICDLHVATRAAASINAKKQYTLPVAYRGSVIQHGLIGINVHMLRTLPANCCRSRHPLGPAKGQPLSI
jgi:hypothetical protein